MKNDLTEARQPPEDFAADAHRLALELECLLLSTKDTAALSRWWDSAHEALEQHRQLVRDTYSEPPANPMANHVETSGSPCPTCVALARAVMCDQTGHA